MSYYDNDYHDDMYDRYKITGEGAEYFEDDYEDEDYYDYEDVVYEEYEVRNNTHFDNFVLYIKQTLNEKQRDKSTGMK